MNREFLYEMLRTESVSGGEIPLQKKVAAYMKEQGVTVNTDPAGDVISSINDDSPFRVLLCGHIDEIGFRVTCITKEGYLHVGKAGGVRLSLAQGKRVTVLGKKRVTGVMGLLLQKGEVKAEPELTDLYIDCGFRDQEDARRLVSPGDFVTYTYTVEECKVLEYNDTSAYDFTRTDENLILYTCYPFDALGFTSQRYFVYASYTSGPMLDADN